MAKRITDKVTWVGKVDWELVYFHGRELSTKRGSSYNSYLIRDKKTVLLDTVWKPFDKEFVSELKREIDLKEIDAIVMHHNEIDHSGALPELLREIPDVPIYCTKNGEAILRGHYHQDWNFVNVKTGDELDLGDSKLIFIEAPMLHWPDTMFSFLTGENILFSNDGFGQHFATESLYVEDQCEALVQREAMKYYANILSPFNMLVHRKVKEIVGMQLPIRMICPSHGAIWKGDPLRIVRNYLEWSDNYKENRVTIVYDTMWNSTRRMAENIAAGIRETDPDTVVTLFNASKHDKNDIVTEVFRSKAVLVGSPTINNGFSYAISGIMEMVQGMKVKGKKAAAFGSYGWSGEAAKKLSEWLAKAGFEILEDGLRCNWVPTEENLADCRAYGRRIGEAVKNDTVKAPTGCP